MKLISTNTKLTSAQLEVARKGIQWRLKRIRNAGIEVALFLMEEVEHLRALIKFNQP